jgi:hypothetical protein
MPQPVALAAFQSGSTHFWIMIIILGGRQSAVNRWPERRTLVRTGTIHFRAGEAMTIWSGLKSLMRRRAPALRQPDERQSDASQAADRVQSAQAPPPAAVAPEAIARLVESVEQIRSYLGIMSGIMTRREMAEVMADRRFEDPLRLERSGFRVQWP